jgi:hypothetical protein
MTFDDPTLELMSRLDINPIESVIGSIFLAIGFLCNILNIIPARLKNSDPISTRIVRTPESAFSHVKSPYRARYFVAHFSDNLLHDKSFRVHYLDEGDPKSREVILCLHGLPFW